jgi:microtubule-associated protein 1 light chain
LNDDDDESLGFNVYYNFFKAARIEEVQGIRAKFPNKIPVIVERFHKERALPALDKTKFLVPQELTMSQFVTIIRLKRIMLLN